LTAAKSDKPLCENGNSSSGQRVNAVNGILHSDAPGHGDLDPTDPDDIPHSFRRCTHCGKGGAVNIVALPDGKQRQLHRECEAEWFATHDTDGCA
jgi:hypothetical protein